MEALFAIVGALASKAAEYTVDPTARQLSYLFMHKTKFLNLRSKVQDLKDAKERVQQAVDTANRNGEKIFDDVQRWLTEVNAKISEQAATQLQEDEEKTMKRCFAGVCTDFNSRYRFSKKADKEANAIVKLLNKKDGFDGVSYRPAIEGIGLIRPVKEFEAFESRIGALDGVMEALEDDAVSIIGVYGMGGVGKTTLAKEVAGQAKEKLWFNEVVFVAVTQTPNTVNIQNEIANKLDLKLEDDTSVDVRAARLRDQLKKSNKVLIILDDIWEEQEVDTLGIPSADQHKGCKVLITSRKLVVLKSMGSQKSLPIDVLKEDEAWNLFKNVTGHVAERSDLQSTAKKVAQKCAGLPLAITTVAKALRHKENLYEWEDALLRLNPSEINYRGISGAVYSAIETSYTYLEPEEHKYIFLICSIMGHDATIQDLVKHCRGLGLFHGLDTMEKVRNRVLTLVNELKDSSLLLAGSTPERFDMHAVVCDVAISIASRDHRWLALRKGDVFEEWSNEDTMRSSDLVSLKCAKVSELPDVLECPNLKFFSMHGTVEVPNNFFNGMQRLKVLEFGRTNFTFLPSSLGSLKTLSTLRLIGCGLKDIAILGELEHLEVLDLSRSTMGVLPMEIGQLTRLKLLDLSECFHLKVISPNVLSSLSRMEELYLYRGFNRWEIEGTENSRSNASLVELQHLSCLTTLELHIPNVETIPEGRLFFGKMERYKISIGNWEWPPYYEMKMKTSRMLKLDFNKSIHLVDRINELLWRKIESLYLTRVEDVWKMLNDPNVESFRRLRFIKVENCNTLTNLFLFSIAKRLCQLEQLEVSNCENIRTIVEEEEIDENILEFSKLHIIKLHNLNRFNGSWYRRNTLQSTVWLFDKKVSCPALEELYLYSMTGIEKIWHIDEQLPLESFGGQCLTILRVNRCRKMKYIFTSSMVKSFVQLKTLEVSECGEMEGVIEGILAATEEERIHGSIRVFPKLDSLKLYQLPKLNRFCHGTNPIEFPSLSDLVKQSCPELKTFTYDNEKSRVAPPHYLFNEKVILPVLEKLNIYKMSNLESLWPDLFVEHSFSRLTSITLGVCPKVVSVFPLRMLTRLQRLNKLEIYECVSLEEIISGSQSHGGGSNNALHSLSSPLIRSDVITFEFSRLTSLTLKHLANLKSIHHKMHTVNWPSLKEMKVSVCDNVEVLFASQETSGNISHQPLFWLNKSTFPNLHKLVLEGNAGVREIIRHCEEQQQQHLSRYFRNLKVVVLVGYREQLTVLPSYWFQLLSFPTLETLEISHYSFKEMIFRSEEGGEEKPASLLLSQITKLRLHFLNELMHLWKENEGFPNLRTLDLFRCPKLKANLVPSSVCFRNLVTLGVWDCDGIIKLITSSTAKSLVQLKEMRIHHCKKIEEIIQGGDDEISFPRLNRIELGYLPKLESFCSSGNYNFRFPSLESLLLDHCSKMKMFSQGDSTTPMLLKVVMSKKWGYQDRWEGSLNNTIQQQFREKNLVQEVQNFIKDQGNSSTCNTE